MARRVGLFLVLAVLPAFARAQPPPLVCEPALAAPALKAEVAAVSAALAEAAPARLAWTRAMEAPDTSPSGQAAVDAAWETYSRRRDVALEGLVATGNSEAMVRLGETLRDSEAPGDIRRWFALTDCASRRGNAFADDELIRWYWHQRGDGGIAAVQAHRGRALDNAAKAARDGRMAGFARVAIYIAGNIHQYPGNLTLARKTLELCARTDDWGCQRILVTPSAYDYGLTAGETAFWLHRLAAHDGPGFAARRDAQTAALTAEERRSVEAALAAWTPQSWSRLEPEWASLRAEILAHGATSVGQDALCATATPWCRGDALGVTSGR